MQENIYILVTQTGTNISKILKLFTRKPYNHVSISCDPNLQEMYSFCRNTPEKPLPATFNKEIVGEGTFGKFSNIPCEIYKIPVSGRQKNLITKNLEHFKNNREYYSYNLIGLGLIFLHIAYNRKNKFVCSQFVSHILEKSEVDLDFSKPSCLLTPEDFRHVDSAELIYKGELNAFYKMKNRHSETFAIPAEQTFHSA